MERAGHRECVGFGVVQLGGQSHLSQVVERGWVEMGAQQAQAVVDLDYGAVKPPVAAPWPERAGWPFQNDARHRFGERLPQGVQGLAQAAVGIVADRRARGWAGLDGKGGGQQFRGALVRVRVPVLRVLVLSRRVLSIGDPVTEDQVGEFVEHSVIAQDEWKAFDESDVVAVLGGNH
jgi:hypothetical protein